MPMSIDTQIQIMTESGFSHDRPVPQIVYDTDYMYVIAGNYTNPSLFKLDYNLNIVMQVNLATLSEYRPYNLHLSYIISDNLYLQQIQLIRILFIYISIKNLIYR